MTAAFRASIKTHNTFPASTFEIRWAIYEHLRDLTMQRHREVCEAFVRTVLS